MSCGQGPRGVDGTEGQGMLRGVSHHGLAERGREQNGRGCGSSSDRSSAVLLS